jgi:hypothetical protein
VSGAPVSLPLVIVVPPALSLMTTLGPTVAASSWRTDDTQAVGGLASSREIYRARRGAHYSFFLQVSQWSPLGAARLTAVDLGIARSYLVLACIKWITLL